MLTASDGSLWMVMDLAKAFLECLVPACPSYPKGTFKTITSRLQSPTGTRIPAADAAAAKALRVARFLDLQVPGAGSRHTLTSTQFPAVI